MNKVGKKGKRNRMAGKHPSYVKLNLSPKAYRKRLAYDKRRQNTPERIAYRVELNRKNRELKRRGIGRVGDVSHRVGYTSGGTIAKNGSYLESAKSNRARRKRVIQVN